MLDISFAALLARLDHPDRLVRLVASQQIKAFLLSSSSSRALDQVLERLSYSQNEMDVVTWLSILAFCKDAISLDKGTIHGRIGHPSILSDMLLEYIFDQPTIVLSWSTRASGVAPNQFQPEEDFEKVCNNIGSIFKDRLRRISVVIGVSLESHWAWEWSQIAKDDTNRSFDAHYFFDRNKKENMGTFEPRSVGILKSAFLRTLAFAIEEHSVPVHIARSTSWLCLPFYLDLANTKAGTRPNECWGTEPLSAKVFVECLESFGRDKDWMLAAASGYWHSNDTHMSNVEIRGAFVSNDQGDDIDGLSGDRRFDTFLLPQDRAFELSDLQILFEGETIRSTDISVVPASKVAFPMAPPCWQIDIILNKFFLPALSSEDLLTIECDEQAVHFFLDEEKIAKWSYWLMEWKPSYPLFAGPRLGAALVIRRDFLEQFSNYLGREYTLFGHGEVYSREQQYGEFEKEVISAHKKIIRRSAS